MIFLLGWIAKSRLLSFHSSMQKQKKPPTPEEAGGVFALNRHSITTAQTSPSGGFASANFG